MPCARKRAHRKRSDPGVRAAPTGGGASGVGRLDRTMLSEAGRMESESSAIVERLVREALAFQRQLTEAVSSGVGLEGIARVLSEIAGRPAVVWGANGVAPAVHPADARPAFEGDGRLLDQHLRPVRGGEPPRAGRRQEWCLRRDVDAVEHRRMRRQRGDVDRHTRVDHPDRGRVDGQVGVEFAAPVTIDKPKRIFASALAAMGVGAIEERRRAG